MAPSSIHDAGESQSDPNKDHADDVHNPNIDGGWAWVVVTAGFFIQVIICGIQLTFGDLFLALMEEFGTDESTTAWIVSIEEFFMFATGLVVSPLLKRFGFRIVTVSGSVISCVGLLLSTQANNVYVLYLTYGVLVGFGCSLQYFTTLISVQYYFKKHRSKATGIVVSGMGVGLLIFGILVQYLLNRFGWRNTLWIEASFLASTGVFGLFIRPLKLEPEAGKITKKEYTTEMIPVSNDATDDNNYKQQNPAPIPIETTFLSKLLHRIRHPDHWKHSKLESQHTEYPEEETHRDNTLSRSDSNGSGHTSNNDEKTPLTEPRSGQNRCHECCEPMDFSLYRDPVFILVCLSSLTYAYGEVIPWIYIPDRAVRLGIESQHASFLISVVGIANIASRLVFGAISDINETVRFVLLSVMIFVEGVISTCSSVLTTYPLMITYAAIYGCASGSVMAVLPVVMADLFGYDKMDMAIAQSLAVRAIAVLVVAPTTGYVVVWTGSVDAPIIMAGTSQIVAGILFVLTKCVPNRNKSS